ncbi:MAG TPA: FAD-dependent monooxygenase [Anaeromyxobacteraceae bacterium]|nr:FAD-dependent monooxygenase [Anaeromyxobacteraceae bacterium]
MREVDLLVAGAGPAGCAAALAARRTAPGLRLLVVDAARFPRDKPCGGAITGGGLRELELCGLALRVPHAIAAHAALRVDGRSTRVALPRPAAVVRRLEWDHDLVAQVRERGVEVAEGAALRSLAREGRAFLVATDSGSVRCRAIVCADGAAGRSRRLLGLPPGRRAPLREQVAPRGQGDLVFDLDAAPAGYAWRFPCLDAGASAESVGIYSMESTPSLSATLLHWMERERLAPPRGAGAAAGNGAAERAEPAPWSLRLWRPGDPVGVPGALLAGDALGADSLAGEGIRYALWSGRLAGEAAVRALQRGAAPSPDAYRRRLRLSRSGTALALLSRLGPRLHGGDPRWRRMAADPEVASALAAIVSGGHPARPLWTLLSRYRALRGAPP